MFTQDSAFSCKRIAIDTNDIISYEVKTTFLGNYKVIFGLRNGDTVKVATSYWEQVEDLFNLINRAKAEEAK